jgi:Dehydrogenases with different specificities (related to short-chain alcohol dehydrogenases)
VSVVTGGAGGVGLATAQRIGRTHHVLLSDIDAARLAQAAGQLAANGIDCSTHVGDVASRSAVDELVAQAVSLGPVRSVIHTAGISPAMGPAETIMRVNAIGTVNVTTAFLPVATEGFALVNVGSMAAHVTPSLLMPTRSYRYALSDIETFFARLMRRCRLVPVAQRSRLAYSISKNFVVWYSARMAGAFGDRGARIVSVSPGAIDTPMGRLEEEDSASVVRYAALKRPARADEIAAVLAFCASPDAGYLTGADILCDGGVVAGLRWRDVLTMARARS